MRVCTHTYVCVCGCVCVCVCVFPHWTAQDGWQGALYGSVPVWVGGAGQVWVGGSRCECMGQNV